MLEYARPLGNSVKNARTRLDMTQSDVAEKANIDARTVMNIENYKGNPKLEIMFPLVRALELDPLEIYYPELLCSNATMRQLQILLSECSENELEALLTICRATLSVLKAEQATTIT